jgi:DNA mismatch repair protein MutL
VSPDIRALDADTRDRIAAGEVVERPASVVKELLENALDADAGRVSVAVEAGGKERVVVSDDGVGMSESAARKAVREHTTSKLRDVGDLDAVGTLGFRGEALHAIGSVARLELRTKPRGGDRGTRLVVEDGEVVECEPVGCPAGTTVEVTDLFGSIPARRKYLKTDATEFAHVQRVAGGYALASPAVAVSLEHDGRAAFSTTGDGDRRSAVMAVYGREVAASMIPIGESRSGSSDDGGGGPLDGVEGLVSHPETNRAGREYVTTLVNGRYVASGVVRDAVVDAYGSQLAPDRYPFAVVDLDVPPGGVDVNVHPRKLEVLFADDEGVREQVRAAVERALLEEGLVRSRAPRGRSAPEPTEIAPESADDPDGAEDSATGTERARGETQRGADAETGAGETSVSGGRPDRSSPAPESDEPSGSRSGDSATADSSESAVSGDATGDAQRGDRAPADGRKFRETPAQRTLDGAETAGTPASLERLPSMDVLGQVDDTYVVAATDEGLVLVDQHAADERVNYERLREAFEGSVTTQALAEPVELELTAREAALVDEHGAALSRLGFHVQRPDERAVAVTTVPAAVAERVGGDAPELARDLLGEFVDGDPRGTVEAVVDDLLGDLACHPSVTGNTSLTEGSVAELLAALDGCENPYACPHGRPTVVELSREEIEERFERDYPGHSGRRG